MLLLTEARVDGEPLVGWRLDTLAAYRFNPALLTGCREGGCEEEYFESFAPLSEKEGCAEARRLGTHAAVLQYLQNLHRYRK